MNRIAETWLDIGAEADIPLRGARVVRAPIGDIAVFKAADGTLFALRDRCPHKGGPLSQGIVHGHAVTCPLHNWVISLETGEAQGADHGCTPKIPLRVENGRVLLDAAAIARLGAPQSDASAA
ncbi:nitrite reductase small subunit NirD [Rhabdaerophilum calidifontis]|uniref:nitrite reductase small subunit NirD n=1 Tax=Rhabdaerophilum calidifontis TaxID=2604328 RepID=UPI00123A2D17